ncbi:MAG: TetR/AcrR family transcriptional regulator [Sulfurovum sp.]|nr:TetR/AcrR family transcriptional regulator [Sulfurovum sp.]
MKKNDYHHGNLKEEFLKIAFDFIAHNDIEKLTLKILSDATNTSRSAIYRHFKSKDALIETMIIEGFEAFDAAVSPILRESDRPLIDRFYLSGKHYIAYAQNHPNLYRLLFGNKYAHIREEVMSLHDERCSGFGALKQAIEEGQKSGIVKKKESFQKAVVVWSSLHGLASLIIDSFLDIENDYERFYDAMFKSLLSGLVTDKVKLLSILPFTERVLTPTTDIS